jgi:hypothetical protein
MPQRQTNLSIQASCKAKFREMQGERGRIGNQDVYKGVCRVMNEAELNALQTDYAQDGKAIDEHFWSLTITGIEELILDHKNCPLEVRNWFELQGIWA